ncbi:histidine phosphatase family protein [Sphingomonas yunnanensis]|uniref:histidine phosphatase family protein n=1 Tax=Sphingomonas yunnanensis TaxID=310400 RepID=UPI001CA78B7F|nr:histidine phosphatase family protein [Sphingomonas yunnanensis]MBY9062202.1 histidine phosphatase family protein [Sphingomonas yunnanensis]
MTRLLLLARHGTHGEVDHVLSGRSEIALSERGRDEAAGLARHLAGVDLSAIYASPRRRTVETAVAVARPRGIDVVHAPALDEIDFGTFTGRDFVALEGDPDWQRWNAERGSARCPGGETMGEAVARAVALLSAAGEGTTLFVTHCDVIRGAVAHWLGLRFERMFQLGCDPGSVTTLALDAHGGATLVALNERPSAFHPLI